MSLDKAIQYGKERRKLYYRSKAFDRSCRNHGGCPWCERNRKYKSKLRELIARQKIMEWGEEFERED